MPSSSDWRTCWIGPGVLVSLFITFGHPLWAGDGTGDDVWALTCYADTDAHCYDPVEKEGRTPAGLFLPQQFKPLAQAGPAPDMDRLWRERPLYLLASLAHAAYLPPAELKAMVANLDGQATVFIDGNRQGYLAAWPQRVVLAFRGSEPEEPGDMVDNLKSDRVAVGGARVHRGFREATGELWTRGNIREALEEALDRSPRPQLVVTGHSLGGAMAVVSALLHPFDQVVTFGQPRVGENLEAGLPPHTDYQRVVNGKDNVVSLPPEFLGFRHLGEVVAIHGAGESAPEPLAAMFLDHSIVNYASRLYLDGR